MFTCQRCRIQGASVVDRLVGQSPEIDVRWIERRPGALGHQGNDHLPPEVGIPGGAQTTVPAIPTGHRRGVLAPGDHGHPEPQPRLSKKPGNRPDTASYSGVSWSVVMSSTGSLESLSSRV